MTDLSQNILSAIVGAVVTALIGVIAYFSKRHIEKTDKGEIDSFIDGYARLKNISESSNPPTATNSEIQELHSLIAKLQRSSQSQLEEYEEGYNGAWTQADLNRIGGAEFAEADARMNLTYTKLKSYQDGSASEAFEDAVKKWKEYRHKYAVFIAETYMGGSIQPLMYSTTAVEITNQFNQLLQIELDECQNR